MIEKLRSFSIAKADASMRLFVYPHEAEYTKVLPPERGYKAVLTFAASHLPGDYQ